MRKFFVFLLSCMMLSSCNKDRPIGGVIISSNICVSLFDVNGTDLLRQWADESDNKVTDKIKVYYMIGKKETLFFNAKYDASRAWLWIDKSSTEDKFQYIQFYLDHNLDNTLDNGKNRTIIEWPDGVRDIIDAEFSREKGNCILQKIWLNDKEMPLMNNLHNYKIVRE